MHRAAMVCAALAAAIGAWAGGCGAADEGLLATDAAAGPGPGSTGAGGSGAGINFGTGGDKGPCKGLECQQVDCPAGQKTTVTGTVYAPSGTLPLYNVLVYVPNAPLAPIPEGASCDPCGNVSGSPVVIALTDVKGQFVLEDVPAGDDIPLVIQVGKWRREMVLPKVAPCADTPLTDVEKTSLPSNKTEGHIPRIALTTGGADPLECLLRKIGLEDSEFTLSTGDGRVNFYAANGGTDQYSPGLNGGAAIEPAQPFWSSLDTLKKYDIVLLACEGGQNEGQKSQPARQAMVDYANLGGRIFMSHWHNVWLEKGIMPWPTTASWDFQKDPPEPYTGVVDQTFPKGKALAEWLLNVGGSTVLGELPITAPQHTLTTVNAMAGVQQWIYGKGPDTGSVKYFTFNAPLGAPDAELCGRVVFSDIHVSSGDQDGTPFPNGCTTQGLSPQEKALVFMLFDLAACIDPDDDPPTPPPV
jgi:hypothetical protein